MACLRCQGELPALAEVTLSPGRKQHLIVLLQSLGRIGPCCRRWDGWEEAAKVVVSKMLKHGQRHGKILRDGRAAWHAS